jgi:histidyl-tRNA synthetase
VLVAVPAEDARPACDGIAAGLRRRGIPVEVAPAAAKYGKQIRFAERRGIPFVWFTGAGDDAGGDTVKDIRSGEQAPATAADWSPPAADLHPAVGAAGR